MKVVLKSKFLRVVRGGDGLGFFCIVIMGSRIGGEKTARNKYQKMPLFKDFYITISLYIFFVIEKQALHQNEVVLYY